MADNRNKRRKANSRSKLAQIAAKRKMQKIKRTLAIAGVLAAVIGVAVFGKYISDKKRTQEMSSSGFHISSDYLLDTTDGSDAGTYNLVDWGKGFDINIFNYEQDNIENILDTEIEYEVKVSSGWIFTVDGVTKPTYKMPVSENRTSQILHITPQGTTTGGDVTVTVTTKSPYKRVMSAVFTTQTKKTPEFSAKQLDDGTIKIEIKTNDYSGSFSVKWDPDKYSPDNANNLMSTWSNEKVSGNLANGVLTVESNSTYELLMFTNEKDFEAIENTGTAITIQ